MRHLMSLLILATFATTALADEAAFITGPVFTGYGAVAPMPTRAQTEAFLTQA